MILFLAMNQGKGVFCSGNVKRENGRGGELGSMLVPRYLFFTTGKDSFQLTNYT